MLAKYWGSRKVRAVIAGLSGLMLVASVATFVAAASDGIMTVNGGANAGAAGGAGGQTFVFAFQNNGGTDYAAGSQLMLTIPAGWTEPQTTDAAGPGYVVVDDSADASCNPSLGTTPVAGSGPWTITVAQTCTAGGSMTITYGAGSSTEKVTPPVATGQYTFTTLTNRGSAAPDQISSSPTITVDTLAITFYKEICARYTDVPANIAPTNVDQTGLHGAELDTSYQTGDVNPATDIPAACTPAGGWSFQLRRGSGGALIETVTTSSDGTYTAYIGPNDLAGARGTDPSWSGVWIYEVTRPDAGFGALRCYQDHLNGDNEDYVRASSTSVNQTYCIAFNVAGPGISLTKTASPSTYALGEPITYTYTVINTSNVPTGTAQFSITDDKLGVFPCGDPSNLVPDVGIEGDSTAGSLAEPSAGSFITCTNTHAATQTDIDNGSIKNDATASYSLLGGTYTSNTATAIVTAKPTLTISAKDQSKTYGTALDLSAPSTTGFTVSGLASGDSVDSVTLTSDGAAADAASGPHAITPSAATGTGLDHYNVVYVAGTMTVDQATLTVTANNQSRAYGATDPAFTYTITGFAAGDNELNSLSATPTCSSTDTSTSAAGTTYPITCDGATAANYSFTYVAGTLTIGKADQTIDFNQPADATYGGAQFPVTATATSGLPVSFTTTPGGHCSVTSTGTVTILSAGTCTITASQAGGVNYNAAPSVDRTFTINQAVLTVTANNASRAYGVTNPPFTSKISGYVNGDTAASAGVSGTAGLSTPATITSPVGSYDINVDVSGMHAANYSFVGVKGTLSVGKANQTITFVNPGNQTVVTPAFDLGATASSGLPVTYTVNKVLGVNSSCTVSGSLVTITGAGFCSITASQPGDATFNAAPNVTRTFLISKLPQTITFNQPLPNVTYGAAPITLTATADSGLPITYIALGKCTVSGTTLTITGAGNCAITATQGGDGTYFAALPVVRTFAIGKAAITITASDQSKTYGTALSLGTTAFTVTGGSVVTGDITQVVLTSAGAAVGAGVGDYPVVASAAGPGAANYTISYLPGNLTVSTAALQITASSATIGYGGPVPDITPIYDGLVGGDTAPATPPTCSTTATTHSPVGSSSPSSCTGAADPNYTITYVDGAITVNDKPTLTITASSEVMTYGGPVPAITPSYSGFIDGDSAADLTTLPTCGTAASDTSPVSGSPYDSSCAGAASPNYNITYAAGTVAVGKADLTITPTNRAKAFGATLNLGTTGFGTSGLVNGDSVTSVDLASAGAVASAVVGPYDITASGATGTGLGNYNVSYGTGTLTVTDRLILTVTANDQSRDYGKANPTLTFTITGYAEGDGISALSTLPTCKTDADAASLPGNYQITCSGAAADAYDFNYVAGTLKVTGQIVDPATGKPIHTPPTTSTGSGPNGDNSTPLFVLLICLAFSGLGLLAVQAQRKSMRS